ncbi:MAG: hypothetical protein RBT69_10475 [Spirochaetia bacterium]|nr:hypothetical protein [Spirochaetia bacterium]
MNSRYKDIYDLYELLIKAELNEDSVITVAYNTFNTRSAIIPLINKSYFTSNLLTLYFPGSD